MFQERGEFGQLTETVCVSSHQKALWPTDTDDSQNPTPKSGQLQSFDLIFKTV